MSMFTNVYGMHGKIIAGVEADSNRPVAYLVPESGTGVMENLAEYLARFNGKCVRITIEHDIQS